MLQSLKHKLKLTTTSIRLISGESQFLRQLCTATAPVSATNPPKRSSKQNISKENLRKRLWEAVNTDETVSNVLHKIMRNGKQFVRSDLLSCLQNLRKFGHYNQCLEIFEWMDNSRIGYSATDYALRLNVMSKVKGIDDIEKYFASIPHDVKNHHILYVALLNCYCTKMMTDEALALFKKMDKLNYVSDHLPFNSLMELYVKVHEPEKVSLLVEEMKQKNIPLTNRTYYMWIQSYRYSLDLEGVQRVMHEVQEQSFLIEDWQIFSNLAAVYIEAGQFEKANIALKKMEDLLDNPKKADRKAYHYLITMYANTGNLDSVYLAWQKLKSRFEVYQNICYLTLLRALSKLNDIEGLKKFLEEWELSYKHYDDRLPAVVIGTYLKHDMLEEAKHLLKDVEDKAKRQTKFAHVVFMNYYLGKHQYDSALKHMEAAMAAKWKPLAEKLDPFFEHFREEKDVDGAEEFCQKLENVQPLDSRTYLWLIQTYEAAGKTAPKMRQRMIENGIDITTKHDELLQKIT